jgi:hypothetical protein
MDMTTGKKWAKRLSSSEQDGAAVAVLPQVDAPVEASSGGGAGSANDGEPAARGDIADAHIGGGVVDDPRASAELMESVLMGLPDPEPDLMEAVARRNEMSKEEMLALLRRVWDRRQVMLREAMSKMKTEAQQMHGVLQRLLQAQDGSTVTDPVADRIGLLEDLEYHVGKVDNARDFGKMGGLTAMCLLLNDSTPQVRSAAAWVVGTAVKYETGLQEEAKAGGAIPLLLDALNNVLQAASPPAAVPSSRLREASRMVYTLGALMRGNTASQREFVQLGGLHVFAHVLHAALDANTHASASAAPPAGVGGGRGGDRGGAALLLQLGARVSLLLGDIVEEGEAGGSLVGSSREVCEVLPHLLEACVVHVQAEGFPLTGSPVTCTVERGQFLEATAKLWGRGQKGQAAVCSGHDATPAERVLSRLRQALPLSLFGEGEVVAACGVGGGPREVDGTEEGEEGEEELLPWYCGVDKYEGTRFQEWVVRLHSSRKPAVPHSEL